MSIYQIPLSTGAQSFSIRLGEYNYRMVRTDGSDALQGLPLVTGFNRLAQFGYKSMGGALWCELPKQVKNYEPTYADMGQTLSLFWSDE